MLVQFITVSGIGNDTLLEIFKFLTVKITIFIKFPKKICAKDDGTDA